MSTLKTCPFCGDDCACPNGTSSGKAFIAFCIGQTDDFPSFEEAEAAWNRRAGDWQPIETAPRDGKPIMIWFAAAGETMIVRWHDDDGTWETDWSVVTFDSDDTWWTPLPPAPEPADSTATEVDDG